jgi:hypothetical protein
LSSLAGGPITTVAPTTTSTALTSIATGLTPGEHGVVGYRINVHGEVLNILRWSVAGRDARTSIPPDKVQDAPSFAGHRPAIVTRAEFRTSGFTDAHLHGARFNGWRTMGTLVGETARLLRENEPFVYCYYDGIDKVAHEYGLGDVYDHELRSVDRMVGDLIDVLPPGAALVITADHGQVDVGDNMITPAPEVMAQVASQSGEGRFRWLHAVRGSERSLLDAAQSAHHDVAWVVGLEQILDEHWFGPTVTSDARARLGDVALVPFAPVAFHDADDTGPYVLLGRHGSMTSAEVMVPLLVAAR